MNDLSDFNFKALLFILQRTDFTQRECDNFLFGEGFNKDIKTALFNEARKQAVECPLRMKQWQKVCELVNTAN